MSDIFLEVSQTINLIGQDKTINLLQKARENVSNPIHIKKIFLIVCDAFKVAIKHIDELKTRTDERLLILSFCTFYAKKKMNCSYEDINIGLDLKLSSKSYSRYCNIIKNANLKSPKSDLDKSISKTNKTINEHINDYFKNLKK